MLSKSKLVGTLTITKSHIHANSPRHTHSFLGRSLILPFLVSFFLLSPTPNPPPPPFPSRPLTLLVTMEACFRNPCVSLREMWITHQHKSPNGKEGIRLPCLWWCHFAKKEKREKRNGSAETAETGRKCSIGVQMVPDNNNQGVHDCSFKWQYRRLPFSFVLIVPLPIAIVPVERFYYIFQSYISESRK